MLFLSGATMPDMLFPDTIKRVSGFLPMMYAVDLMREFLLGIVLVYMENNYFIESVKIILYNNIAFNNLNNI